MAKLSKNQKGYLIGVSDAPKQVTVCDIRGKDYILSDSTGKLVAMRDKAIIRHFVPEEDFYETAYKNGVKKHGKSMNAKQYFKLTWLK